MMENPIKQHNTPKAYLKRFANDFTDETGSIFKFRVRPLHWKKRVEPSNISAICYKKDFFTIETDNLRERYDLDDPYYIERFVFPYEDTFLTEILDCLTKRDTIARQRYKRFLLMLLDIKYRNPSFHANYQNTQLMSEAIERNVSLLKRSENKHRAKLEEKGIPLVADKVAEMMRSRLLSEPFRNDLYRESFLVNHLESKTTPKDQVAEFLFTLKPFIYKTSSAYPFITSDNAGGVLLKDESIQSVGFNENFALYYFPIDPQHALCLKADFKDKQISTFRKIHYLNASNEFVDHMNKAAIANCN